MTITAPDFEAAIDAAPRGDQGVRFAYADWLEEQGDAAGARFQRWMGEWRRSTFSNRNGEWLWCEAVVMDDIARVPSTVPREAMRLIRFGLSSTASSSFPTRIAAEAALRTALEAVEYEVTW